MKKVLLTTLAFLCLCNTSFAKQDLLSVKDLKNISIVSNSSLNRKDLEKAQKIILDLHNQTLVQIEKGYGPFLAAIYDEKGNLIAQMPNTVVREQNCLNHAEMNTIKEAQKKLKTYDLAPYHLSIYINAEPCIMCAGGIMWSGIDNVYYSVNSKDVETITGFDEGYKGDWQKAFKERNINVYGNIESETGKDVLKKYVAAKKEIYKPSRK